MTTTAKEVLQVWNMPNPNGVAVNDSFYVAIKNLLIFNEADWNIVSCFVIGKLYLF